MLFKKSVMTAAVFAVGSFAVMSANAGTAIGTVPVSVEVQAICDVNASTPELTIDAIKGGKAVANTTGGSAMLTINCSKGALPRIGLQPNSTKSALGIGEMTGETSLEKIKYKLTSVSSSGGIWGSTDGVNTVAPAASTGYADNIDNTIYATITETADVAPDTYSDIINVSILY